jgi:hypothetical protein
MRTAPALALCAALIAAVASCENERVGPLVGELSLSFPDYDGGTLPFVDGGLVRVDLAADVWGLCTPVHATLEIAGGLADAGTATAVVALEGAPGTRDPDCIVGLEGQKSHHTASAVLTWPAGGAVSVRAHLLDLYVEKPLSITVPRLKLFDQSAAGSSYTVCAASSAASGLVTLAYSAPGDGGGVTSSTLTLPLVTGDCAADAGLASHVDLTFGAVVGKSVVTATLSGTALTDTLALQK